MRVGSVCSGIAADAVAWAPLGWQHVFFAENARFPSQVLAARWPDVPNLDDFTRLAHARKRPPPIDLLVGGTPCQSFSVAGLRGGMDDTRGGLALEFLRLARRARPQWLVWENVPGVLSSGLGRDFGAFLGGLAELRYGWAYRVLDAQHFGVPQQRRRVFVVGCAGDWRGAAAVLFERACLRWDSPPRRGERAEAARALTASAGRSGDRDNLVAQALLTKANRNNPDQTYVIQDAREGSRLKKQNGIGIREDGVSYTLDRGSKHAIAFDLAQLTHPENRSNPQPGNPAPCLGKSTRPAIAFSGRQDPSSGELSPTLTASRSDVGVTDGFAVRYLTPLERERLQGFPDGYTALPKASDTARNEVLGNTMAVPVMRWLGERINAVEQLKEAA